MKLAIIGITGLVGRELLKVLEKYNLAISELIPVASKNSIGKKISFKGNEYEVVDIESAIIKNPSIAIFSAGASVSLEWAPKFAENGIYVIDNSSAWRMHPDKKLIVPEINGHLLCKEDYIIANPNCSTIQMLMALAPLDARYTLRSIVVSTYQSFTGTGAKAVNQYNTEKSGNITEPYEMAYHYPIFENCIPQCDVFLENDYTKEEMKMVHETHKILGRTDISISPTAVRVPVDGGHSESIHAIFEGTPEVAEVRNLYQHTPGIKLMDDPSQHEYPMPLLAKGKDEVFVGRIRKDLYNPHALNLWVVADNLRKGAATNAVQIAEIVSERFVNSKA